MGREYRLKEVYEYVRQNFPIHTQADFAIILKYNRAYISSAMNGNEKYLTDNLFKNICEAFPGVFNLDYLLTGNGDLLTHEEDAKGETLRMECEQRQQSFDVNKFIDKAVEIAVAGKNETINALKSHIKDKDDQLADKERTIRLLEQKIEILEAMQHIDTENPLRTPFPVGVADKRDDQPSTHV